MANEMTIEDFAIKLRAMAEASFELELRHLPELRMLEHHFEAKIRSGEL